MELRHLRSLVTLVDMGFSVSRAAVQLHVVQPAVSQHLRQLEDEIGARLFVRQGRRLIALTEAGERVLEYSRQVLAQTNSILAIGRDHTQQSRGELRIATTHTQARYVLPPVIRRFAEKYPAVSLQIHQGTPAQLVDAAVHDSVDFAICTEALGEHPLLRAIPCYRWNRCVIAPGGHPVLIKPRVTLKQLCAYPVITYVFGFTGRGHFSDTFVEAGLRPDVVLSAADTDVIKTYVREGLGIGIIARLAYDAVLDADLGMRDLHHLFPWETTKIAYARGKYLRTFQQDFIDMFQDTIRQSDTRGGLQPCSEP